MSNKTSDENIEQHFFNFNVVITWDFVKMQILIPYN